MVPRAPRDGYNAAVRQWRVAKKAAGYCAAAITCWRPTVDSLTQCRDHARRQATYQYKYRPPKYKGRGKMLVVLAMPGLRAEVRDIPSGDACGDAIRVMVGGWFDKTYWPLSAEAFPADRKAVLWVNDEGIRERLAPNLPHPSGIWVNNAAYLLGPVVVSAYDPVDGDELGIPDTAAALKICRLVDRARGL